MRRHRRRDELAALVIRALVEAREPVGAYALASRLEAQGTPIAPTQIYRTLGHLRQAGQVVRIESLSAYVAAESGAGAHLICTACGRYSLADQPRLMAMLAQIALARGLRPTEISVEIKGLCGCTGDAFL